MLKFSHVLLRNFYIIFCVSLILCLIFTSIKAHSQTLIKSIYIFDHKVKDIGYLSENITEPIYTIHDNSPVIEQLAVIANKHPDANLWNIVSHGQPGIIELGNEHWDNKWLSQTDVSLLRTLLPEGSHWNLYACDLARGEEGNNFVETLSHTLDISISASTNQTGTIAGADTQLEYQTQNMILAQSIVKSTIDFGGYPYTLTLSSLEDYATGNASSEPTSDTYETAGVQSSDIVDEYIKDYNRELVNQKDTLSFDDPTDIIELVRAINVINKYASSPALIEPAFDTYVTAGFNSVTALHVKTINQALKLTASESLSGVDSVVAALEKLNRYALGVTVQAPDISDYNDIGLSDIDSGILAHINEKLFLEKQYVFDNYLKPRGTASSSSALFGYRTALSDDGNLLAVLAKKDLSTSTVTTSNYGAVYLYRKNGRSWEYDQALKTGLNGYQINDIAMNADGTRIALSTPERLYIFDKDPDYNSFYKDYIVHRISHDQTILEMSADGKTLAIAGRDNDTSDIWYTQLFRLENNDWTLKQTISSTEDNKLGFAMSLSETGDVLALSCYGQDEFTGVVHVYRHDDEMDEWFKESGSTLHASNKEIGDYYGRSLSLNREGNRLAVGATSEDGQSTLLENQGAVYVYDYDGTDWIEMSVLRSLTPSQGDNFGRQVSLSPSGDQLVVTTSDAEALYIYDLSSKLVSNWSSSERRFNSPSPTDDEFGERGLAFNGTTVVIGAHEDNNGFIGQVDNLHLDDKFDEKDNIRFDRLDASLENSGAVYTVYLGLSAFHDLNSLINRIESSNDLLNWAKQIKKSEPTLFTYEYAAIRDVNNDNLSVINDQLKVIGTTSMVDVQPTVDAINIIMSYLKDNELPPPSFEDYKLAGFDVNNYDKNKPHETLNRFILQKNITSFAALKVQFDTLKTVYDSLDTPNVGVTSFTRQDYEHLGVNLGNNDLVDHINKYTIPLFRPGFTHYIEAPEGITLQDCKSTEVGITVCTGRSYNYRYDKPYDDRFVVFTARNKHVQTSVIEFEKRGSCSDAPDWALTGNGFGFYRAAYERYYYGMESCTDDSNDYSGMFTATATSIQDGLPNWENRRGGSTRQLYKFSWPILKYPSSGGNAYKSSNWLGAARVVAGYDKVIYSHPYHGTWDDYSTTDLSNNTLSRGGYYILGGTFYTGHNYENAQHGHAIAVSYDGHSQMIYRKKSYPDETKDVVAMSGPHLGSWLVRGTGYNFSLSPTGKYIYIKNLYGVVSAYRSTKSNIQPRYPYITIGDDNYLPFVDSFSPGNIHGLAHWSENEVLSSNSEGFWVTDVSNVDEWTSSKIIDKPTFISSLGLGAAGMNKTVAFITNDNINLDGYVYNQDLNADFTASYYSSSDVSFDPTITMSNSSSKLLIAKGQLTSEEWIERVQTSADASNRLLNWAGGTLVVEPTLVDYIESFHANASFNHLDDLNKQLLYFGHSHIDDIQPMIDAIKVIRDYSNSSITNSIEPTADDYELAGIPLWKPVAEMNDDIVDKDYTIQQVIELFPYAFPLLDADQPLHTNDVISWMNKTQALELYESVSPGITANMEYIWQSYSQNGLNWQDIGSKQPINTDPNVNVTYTSLNTGTQYRLKLIVYPDNSPSFEIESTSTSVVMDTSDADIVFDPILTPTEEIAYRVSTKLVPENLPYKQKVTTFYRYNANGTLTPLHQGESYKPTSGVVGSHLVVKVAYENKEQSDIVSRYVITPKVEAGLSSTELAELANQLTLNLTPNGVSVNTVVSLTPADKAAIAASSVNVEYLWKSGDIGNFEEMSTATLESYIAQGSDVGKRLRLMLTLESGGDKVVLVSQPTGKVLGNDTNLDTFALFLQFDSSSNILSLTDASKNRLDEFITVNDLTVLDYQWWRIPESGDFDLGGEWVDSGANGYRLRSPDDVEMSHGLRVTLVNTNGDTVPLFSAITPVWDGNQDTGDNRDLAIELARLRYMDVVTLQGGSTPALTDDELEAVLSGSVPEKDLLPP
ncbi:DUF4347 domain-containing protein, partial [Photobacterium leiognathi]|uniref:DUF4347 domain-containing protein n=2 Tax=Photobacterium leiognathi TaxID=553611 RepID=UPI0011B1FB83